MKTFNFYEARNMMYKFNEDNALTHKDEPGKRMSIAAVLAPHVFREDLRDQLTEEDRTYIFSNNNKMFFANMLSSSCFSYCKTDRHDCIRLDYLPSYEKDIEYCYIVE